MKTYEQMRRDRYNRYSAKFGRLIEALEEEYLKVSGIFKDKEGDDYAVTEIRLSKHLEKDLMVFLADYKALTGVPIIVTTTDSSVQIRIQEKI